MKHKGLRIGIFTLALGLGTSALLAATPEETQAQLDLIQQTLAQSTATVSQITSALAEALKAQSDISDQLISLGKQREQQQAAIAASATKIKTLETQAITLASDLAAKQDELSTLLAGLQRLQANPPPALIVEPENVLDALRGAMMFGAVVPEIRQKAESLRDQLTALESVRKSTAAEKQQLELSVAAAEQSRLDLLSLQKQKKAFADLASQNLESEKRNAASLAEKAKNLQQLLQDLQKAKEQEEAKKSAQAKAAAEAAAKAEADRLAALEKPHAPLSSLKGKLAYPVQGAIVGHFGEDSGLGSPLEGLAFAVAPHANVTAPADGKVEFAGPFRSYGQLLILDAGEGYLVLLAGMKQISVEMGQTVKAGEPVGVMGEGPSSLALLGENLNRDHPTFYVEFRKDNAPVDSTPWWEGGKNEAMK